MTNCPNCGANITKPYSHNCPYCKTYLVLDEEFTTQTEMNKKYGIEEKKTDYSHISEIDQVNIFYMPYTNDGYIEIKGKVINGEIKCEWVSSDNYYSVSKPLEEEAFTECIAIEDMQNISIDNLLRVVTANLKRLGWDSKCINYVTGRLKKFKTERG